MEPDKKRYNKLLPARVVEDLAIDVEMEKDESPADLDARSAAALKAEAEAIKAGEKRESSEWLVDFLIAATSKHYTRVLVKYTGYSRPCFVAAASDYFKQELAGAWGVYAERIKLIDLILARLQKTLPGKQFTAAYPRVWAHKEDGEGRDFYAVHSHNIFRGRLRALEWRLCLETAKIHQPRILIENFVDEEFPEFKYTCSLLPSGTVKRALHRIGEHTLLKKPDVIIQNEQSDVACGCNCSTWIVDGLRIECREGCGCKRGADCTNRRVQRGRQVELMVFKDPRKGFILIAGEDIKEGDFVCEYTGQVITERESWLKGNSMYTMEMHAQHEETVVIKRGKKRSKKLMIMPRLIVDASEWGNESRHAAHSCRPNMVLKPVLAESYGPWYSRMPFYALRDVKAGEELTFDYMPQNKTRGTWYHEFFEDCCCGSGSKCKYIPLSEEQKKWRREALDERRRKQLSAAQNKKDPWDLKGPSVEEEGNENEEPSSESVGDDDEDEENSEENSVNGRVLIRRSENGIELIAGE